MANWGDGNFDSDDALDMLAHWQGMVIAHIREMYKKHMSDQSFLRDGDSDIVANVDILVTLCKHYEVYTSLTTEEVGTWKSVYLTRYDKLYEGSSDVVKPRRKIIEETFVKLYAICEEFESDDHGYD